MTEEQGPAKLPQVADDSNLLVMHVPGVGYAILDKAAVLRCEF